jgi:hypothetical protein
MLPMWTLRPWRSRYEGHLDRQRYRAMDQLERLQRQRRGENVPPPLNINLGRGPRRGCGPDRPSP